MAELNVGIIGTGAIGREHAKRFQKKISNSKVVAVNDVAEKAARSLIDEICPDAVFFSDPKAMIDDTSVDAVVVTSPGFAHAEVVLEAIKAGKPVFCEKPLATKASDARKIVEAEIAGGKKLVQVGFMRRYDAGYKMLKKCLDQGEIGDALMLHCCHRNPDVPEAYKGDMPFNDTFIHEIDVLRWLVGDDYESVQVLVPKQSRNTHSELQDPLMVILKTKSGILIDTEIFVNCRYGYDIQCQVVGETGTANLPEPMSLLKRKDASLATEILMDWKDRFIDAYDVELQDWVDSTLTGEVNGPNAWDGYFAAVTADACSKARKSGDTVKIETGETPEFYK